VTARVHHADILPVVGRAHGRLEWHVDLLGHGQCVHVRAKRNDWTWATAFENAHDARLRYARTHVDTERAEMIRDELRGANLSVRELRMLMDVAAPRDRLCLELRRSAVDLARQRGARTLRNDTDRHGDHRDGEPVENSA
jgi:hypothetical protein